MDLHMALVAGDARTHLTGDATKTLCDKEVLDLPERATAYCTLCIDKEFDLGKVYVMEVSESDAV